MTISPLSTKAIIPDEIRQAFPFLIPFGIIGLWRWALFVIRIIFWLLYRPLYPKRHDDGSSANKYKTTDVTIIVPTIDNGEEFKEAARLWKVNDPYEVIVVTSDEMRDEIQATCDDVDPTLFKVLSVPKPNKRVQLMAGIHATKTDIVALADDDAIWTENFLEWMLAPFDDDEMGGTGSKQVSTYTTPVRILMLLSSLNISCCNCYLFLIGKRAGYDPGRTVRDLLGGHCRLSIDHAYD